MSWLALLSLAMTPQPTHYPVASVWRAFTAFCSTNAGVPRGWVRYFPKRDTSLAYLSEDPGQRLTGQIRPPATVFTTKTADRNLFAFKRKIGDSEFCQAYDFDAVNRLSKSDWTAVVGSLSRIDEREYTQEFRFGVSKDPLQADGTIILQQKGYFPIPDTVGFTGLQIIKVSKETQ